MRKPWPLTVGTGSGLTEEARHFGRLCGADVGGTLVDAVEVSALVARPIPQLLVAQRVAGAPAMRVLKEQHRLLFMLSLA